MVIAIRSWVPSGNCALGIPSHSSSLPTGFQKFMINGAPDWPFLSATTGMRKVSSQSLRFTRGFIRKVFTIRVPMTSLVS